LGCAEAIRIFGIFLDSRPSKNQLKAASKKRVKQDVNFKLPEFLRPNVTLKEGVKRFFDAWIDDMAVAEKRQWNGGTA